MTRRPRFAPLAIALLTLLVASAPGCGKSSTNPPGGGGTLELDSPFLAAGGVYAHMFATAGTYNYHCKVHGLGMAGTVTVAGGGAMGAAVAIQDNLYNPASVTIAPGQTVTWTANAGNANNHTVTSN